MQTACARTYCAFSSRPSISPSTTHRTFLVTIISSLGSVSCARSLNRARGKSQNPSFRLAVPQTHETTDGCDMQPWIYNFSRHSLICFCPSWRGLRKWLLGTYESCAEDCEFLERRHVS